MGSNDFVPLFSKLYGSTPNIFTLLLSKYLMLYVRLCLEKNPSSGSKLYNFPLSSTISMCIYEKDWLPRLDDDDVATNLPLQRTLRVDRRSCTSCSLSYDAPPSRDVVHTLVAGPRTTGSAVLDNRTSKSLPEVSMRRSLNRRLEQMTLWMHALEVDWKTAN